MNLEILENLDVVIQYNVPLAEFTTFHLGGPCKGLIQCQTPLQLETVVTYFINNNFPFLLIGGGSNLVISDQGVNCYVIRYLSNTPIIKRDGNDLIVSGSTILDDLAQYAIECGLEGLTYTSGIPGTVGGAVVGNAGAFGKQVGDVTKSVTLLTKEGIKKHVGPEELNFQYRDSDLKKTGDILLSVCFGLTPGDKIQMQNERHELLRIRHEKHPNLKTHPCAGSFFRNIEPTSKAGKRQAAGWFLEQAGGSKLKYGGAVIFEKHANIIVKSDGCCAQDVYELSKEMMQIVKDQFNLDLVREVRFVGSFKGIPTQIKDIVW